MSREREGRARELHVITAEARGVGGVRARARGAMEAARLDPPQTPAALSAWLARHLDLRVADRPLMPGHAAPLDYLVHAFFEGAYVRAEGGGYTRADAAGARTADCVVWANRGGGKTFLGAVATLLDLLFKPGVQVRVLAGSLEQSRRMHAYLTGLVERSSIARGMDADITTRAVRVGERGGGGAAEVLAASQTSVRGTRVQKLRCDEADLLDPALWEAAQLVTRSLAPCPGPWGGHVRGSVEALSTMHAVGGLMSRLVGGGVSAVREGAAGRPVFRWGVVDCLEHCPEARACDACGLLAECAGRAKDAARAPGHVTIDDALVLKSRVDVGTWRSEMLCLRPSTRHAVYPEFDASRHVVEAGDARLVERRAVAWFGAMDFGIRAESVVLLASVDARGVLWVEHEHAATDRPVTEQVEVLRGWIDAGLAGPALAHVAIDPAGNNRSDQTGVANASLLRDAGWRVLTPRRKIEEGLRLVRRRLAPADGSEPRLLVHARCRRLIECLTCYRYPARDLSAGTPEKGEFDHACDALRYLVVSLDAAPGLEVGGY